jgi:hypothetical protein
LSALLGHPQFLLRNGATLSLDQFAALHRKNKIAPGGQADRHAPAHGHIVWLGNLYLCAAQFHSVGRLVNRLCYRRGGEQRDKACEQELHRKVLYAYAKGFALPRRCSKYQSSNARNMSIWSWHRHVSPHVM